MTTLAWQIGGYRVALDCQDDTLPVAWRSTFPFHKLSLEHPEQSADVLIEATAMSHADYYKVSDIHLFESSTLKNGRIHVDYPPAKGILTYSEGKCRGRFALDPGMDWGLQLVFRISIALLAEASGNLLVHASGVWRDGRVWLFSGPSGAGKTTIAVELRENGLTFTEDLALVGWDDNGNLGVQSTPFGLVRDTRGCPDRGPLAGIVAISQAEKTELRQISTNDAVMLLFRQSKWYSRDASFTLRVLDIIGRIVESGLTLGMDFTRTPDFWRLLDNINRVSYDSAIGV